MLFSLSPELMSTQQTTQLKLCIKGFPHRSVGKSSACNAGDLGSSPGSGRSLKKEMATSWGTLAWEIPETEEPGGLQSMGLQLDTR